MKNLLILLVLLPLNLFSQYVKVPTHYNAEDATEHILHGDLRFYLQDTIEYVVEKKNDKYSTSWLNKEKTSKNVYSILSKGKPEQGGRTNGGYTFTITVVDKKDDTKILRKVVFTVDAFTQKIKTVEILRGI